VAALRRAGAVACAVWIVLLGPRRWCATA
jgi:hypothetical protein